MKGASLTRDEMSPISPEGRLLLATACSAMDEESVRRAMEAVERDLDWTKVVALAKHHRVVPLLHWNLERHWMKEVPREVREELAVAFRNNQDRMEVLGEELLCLMEAFETEGIEALPVKGPSLSARLYGNVPLRPAGDLDILVREADVPGALDVLSAHGYSVKFGKLPPTERQRAGVYRYLYDFHLVDEQRAFSIELHFALSPRKLPYRVNLEDLFARASRCTVAGYSMRILGDEDNLIYLCVHAAKHGWGLLEWLVGVVELLRRMEPLDMERIWELAERQRAEVPLLLGLSLAKQCFQYDPLPALTARAAAWPVVCRLSADVCRRFDEVEDDPAAEKRFQWALCQSPRRKLYWWFCTHLQPERADIKFANLPVPSCYYAVRPIRQLWKMLIIGMRKTLRAAGA